MSAPESLVSAVDVITYHGPIVEMRAPLTQSHFLLIMCVKTDRPWIICLNSRMVDTDWHEIYRTSRSAPL
jgi:hypothetical protein